MQLLLKCNHVVNNANETNRNLHELENKSTSMSLCESQEKKPISQPFEQSSDIIYKSFQTRRICKSKQAKQRHYLQVISDSPYL